VIFVVGGFWWGECRTTFLGGVTKKPALVSVGSFARLGSDRVRRGSAIVARLKWVALTTIPFVISFM